MLFADDFVGVSESRESLEKLIDVLYRHCDRWRLKANVGIRVSMMVFSKYKVEGRWKCEEPKVLSIHVDFATIDVHIKRCLSCV